MSQLPAMPMWWSDFFTKTDHLTNEEQWAYAKLLAKTWLRNCKPFPDNDKDLARLLDMTEKRWLKIRPRIAPFFDLSEGTWRQERLENEFAFVAERAENSRRNGKQGGRPKSIKNNNIENPAGSQQVTQTKPTHTHTQKEGSLGSNEPKGADAPPTPPNLVVVAGTESGPEPGRRREPPDEKAELYRYGKSVLGKSAGGMITRLLKVCEGNVETCTYTLKVADRRQDPREYVGAILRGEQTPDEDWGAIYKRWGVI